MPGVYSCVRDGHVFDGDVERCECGGMVRPPRVDEVCRCGHERSVHQYRLPQFTGLACFYRNQAGICDCPCMEYEREEKVNKAKKQKGKFVVMVNNPPRFCTPSIEAKVEHDTFMEAKKAQLEYWGEGPRYFVAYVEPEPGVEVKWRR